MSEDRSYSQAKQLDRAMTSGKKRTKGTSLDQCRECGQRFDSDLTGGACPRCGGKAAKG